MNAPSTATDPRSTFAEKIPRYRSDPIAFMREILGVEFIWERMVEMAESVRDNPRTAVAGCHSSSKTFTAACLAWWWVLCHQPAKVVLTSPKEGQLKDVLWAEIRNRYDQAVVPLGGELLSLHWKFTADTFIAGFTAKKDSGAEGATGMQGYKSPRLLLIFDEAVGIDRAFYQSAPGILTYPENRWLAMANPTNPNCGFRDCWRAGSGWNAINIDALDTPNLREGRIVNPHLPNAEWVEMMRASGEGSPTWESRVRGRFPSSAINTLISIADLEMAFDRKPVHAMDEDTHIGVDVARQGDDFSSIAVIRGEELVHLEWFHLPDLMKVAGEVLRVARDFGLVKGNAGHIAVDATGMGWGVVDALNASEWKVDGIDFGSRPVDTEQFYDRRTEMWDEIRLWLQTTAQLSEIPIDWRRHLESDLCGCIVDRGKVKGGITVTKLEAKPDMKKRLGHSPDHGDALALALSHRSARRSFLTPDAFPQAPEFVENPRLAQGDPSDRDHPGHARWKRKQGFYSANKGGAGFYE